MFKEKKARDKMMMAVSSATEQNVNGKNYTRIVETSIWFYVFKKIKKSASVHPKKALPPLKVHVDNKYLEQLH